MNRYMSSFMFIRGGRGEKEEGDYTLMEEERKDVDLELIDVLGW